MWTDGSWIRPRASFQTGAWFSLKTIVWWCAHSEGSGSLPPFSRCRWVLLNHHHWAVSFVRPDKLLCTADEEEEMESLQLMPSVQVFSQKGPGRRRVKNSVRLSSSSWLLRLPDLGVHSCAGSVRAKEAEGQGQAHRRSQ